MRPTNATVSTGSRPDESAGSEGWRAVDTAGDAEAMIGYLDRAAVAMSSLRSESITELRLGPGGTVLDAGCGSGVAALELADVVGTAGLVHAIDPSEAMVASTVARAGSQPVSARVGDVRCLELPDNCCDGARTERVLIHLAPDEARSALGELARVVRPGGRISLIETCHAQCRIDGDDLILPSVAKVVANPTMGLNLRAALLAAGCEEVVSEPRPLVFTTIADLHPVVRLEVVARAALSVGASQAEVESAMADMRRRDENGTFFAVMMFYLASGTVTRTADPRR
jgi:SAM-dependent methyltransferase